MQINVYLRHKEKLARKITFNLSINAWIMFFVIYILIEYFWQPASAAPEFWLAVFQTDFIYMASIFCMIFSIVGTVWILLKW